MKWDLRQRPDFGICQLTFDQPGEQMVVEASAMVARDSNVDMTTNMKGGLGGALKRKISGESVFQNTFTASSPGETLWFAPGADGDMECHIMDGSHSVMLASSCFVAAAPSVELDTKFAGVKGFFSGTKLFLIKCDGQGPLFFGSYGAIHAVDVGPAGYICDTQHIVGFTGGLDYQLRGVGGLKGFFASGEGFVCEFKGQGRLWLATRSAGGIASFLQPFRPTKN